MVTIHNHADPHTLHIIFLCVLCVEIFYIVHDGHAALISNAIQGWQCYHCNQQTPTAPASLDYHCMSVSPKPKAPLESLRLLWQHSPDSMFIIRVEDGRYYLDDYNPAQQRALPPGVDMTRPLDEIVPAELYRDIQARYTHCIESRQPMHYEEPGVGDDYWFTMLVPLVEEGKAIEYIAGVARNIKELKESERRLREAMTKAEQLNHQYEQLNIELEKKVQQRTEELNIAKNQAEQQAWLDPLTGIANRRKFEDRLAQEWGAAQRDRQRLSLVMIDIDYFKDYNDTHGHLEGDWALKQVALVLQSHMRRPRDLVARIGGEEFVVLLPETDQPGAEQLMQECQQALAAMRIAHHGIIHSDHPWLSVSIGGMSSQPEKTLNPDAALRIADEMLYRAKHEGRNCIRWRSL